MKMASLPPANHTFFFSVMPPILFLSAPSVKAILLPLPIYLLYIYITIVTCHLVIDTRVI